MKRGGREQGEERGERGEGSGRDSTEAAGGERCRHGKGEGGVREFGERG